MMKTLGQTATPVGHWTVCFIFLVACCEVFSWLLSMIQPSFLVYLVLDDDSKNLELSSFAGKIEPIN